MSLEIKKELPPNIGDIIATFKVKPEKVVFCYSPYLYNPSGAYIPDNLLVHEEIHEKQQNGNPEDWWKKYLIDIQFRIDQELEAYREQYKFYCKQYKDRNTRARFLHILALDFSSEMYGSCISYQEAVQRIKNGIV